MLKRQVRVQKVSESNSKKWYRMHKNGILLPLCNLFTAFYFSFEVYDICSDCPLVLICTRGNGTFRHLKLRESGHIRWSEVGTKSIRLSVFVGTSKRVGTLRKIQSDSTWTDFNRRLREHLKIFNFVAQVGHWISSNVKFFRKIYIFMNLQPQMYEL